MTNPKLLLGGVPFGCDNIGDEAILACVVNLIREQFPNSEIMVSTNDQHNTEKLLNVSSCPLYGFDDIHSDRDKFLSALEWSDAFIWAGATGLSDYPESGLRCLEAAQSLGVKTFVFCTGMNNTMNPAHFRLTKGKKLALLKLLSKLNGNKFDLVKSYEKRKLSNMTTRIKSTLDLCELVVNRDPESQEKLMESNLSHPPLVGADPAITLPLTPPTKANWNNELRQFLKKNPNRIGVCISSQQAITQQKEFATWLDQTIIKRDTGVVFIPMNPITDFELMADIRESMVHKERTTIATGSSLPSDIAGLAAEMDVVISSRLHLLIFASISATPCIGIGRGSKVRNFLSQMGQNTAGSTDRLDFDTLESSLQDITESPLKYQQASCLARTRLLARLNRACEALFNEIHNIHHTEHRLDNNCNTGI